VEAPVWWKNCPVEELSGGRIGASPFQNIVVGNCISIKFKNISIRNICEGGKLSTYSESSSDKESG
jgi:hypothetical protein